MATAWCWSQGIVGEELFACLLVGWLANRIVGRVVKMSASRAEDPGFDSCSRPDLKIGTPVTALSGAWHYRVKNWLAQCQYTVTG